MRVFLKNNVLEEALERTRYIFNEFDDIVIGMSGGKDSTVVFNLALQVARELNRLPLKVMFLDQEAEWQGTIDYVDKIMSMPDIKPYWYQIPMHLTNNASSYNRYNYCWKEEEKAMWIHPQRPDSIKINNYGTDRFHDLFPAIMAKDFAPKTAKLAGVRAEESPMRALATTNASTYKHITWGRKENSKLEQYVFYPIYDWSYTDVWKYILDNDLPYNKVYDGMYRHGVGVREMRISNLHHETAIQVLLLVQEIEPQTWLKVAERIDGANTIKHIKRQSFKCPDKLPFMFRDWEEYALYLIDHMVTEQKYRDFMHKKINFLKARYDTPAINEDFYKTIITTVLSNDWDLTKLHNWMNRQDVYTYTALNKGIMKRYMLHNDRYLSDEQKNKLVETLSARA